jgi:hypothetical protein
MGIIPQHSSSSSSSRSETDLLNLTSPCWSCLSCSQTWLPLTMNNATVAIGNRRATGHGAGRLHSIVAFRSSDVLPVHLCLAPKTKLLEFTVHWSSSQCRGPPTKQAHPTPPHNSTQLSSGCSPVVADIGSQSQHCAPCNTRSHFPQLHQLTLQAHSASSAHELGKLGS